MTTTVLSLLAINFRHVTYTFQLHFSIASGFILSIPLFAVC